MKGLSIFVYCLCIYVTVLSQNTCSITLINRAEATPLVFSNCFVGTEKTLVQTDADGRLTLPENCTFPCSISVYTLTCKQDLLINSCGETLSVYCPDIQLPTAEFTWLDGKGIIKKAAAAIAENYPDSGFVLYGLYRNYKNINHQLRELTEARSVVAMRVDTTDGRLHAREAFGVRALRRTPYTIHISTFYDRQMEDLFLQNPVYHPQLFPISPLYIDHCTFMIDSTASTDSTWTVLYGMHHVSGENHGISNFKPEDFAGEADETGYFVIRRDNFAILQYVRESVRDKKYGYPGHNNFLHPDMLYTGEFIEAYLQVDYTEVDGRYIPLHIFHAHTNTFTHVATNTQVYYVTDYSEWHCDSVTMQLTQSDYQLLLDYKNDLRIPYTYQDHHWTSLPPLVFVDRQTLDAALEKNGGAVTLFEQGGR